MKNGNGARPILTVREAAEFLRVHPTSIYRLAGGGELPAFRLGGTWRFSRAELEKWIVKQTATDR